VLAAFRAEVEAVMAHCGARSIADLAPDFGSTSVGIRSTGPRPTIPSSNSPARLVMNGPTGSSRCGAMTPFTTRRSYE
jgi:hypothetical protein